MNPKTLALVFCLATFLSPRFAKGEDKAEDAAIANYLKPIISSIASDPNVGAWTWETNGNGGYLLRMEMDVNGDGRKELFLTTSLTAAKHSAKWTVFDASTSGTLRPYARTIEFAADSVWPSRDQTPASLIYVAAPSRERMKASETAVVPVSRFTLVFPEIEKLLSYVTEEAAASLRPTDQDRLPKLQAILLADYLTGTDATWADVEEWKMDTHDSFFRPADRDRAAANTAFTPAVALRAINQRLQADARQSSPAPSTPPAPAMSSPLPSLSSPPHSFGPSPKPSKSTD